ncbi:MAG: hypothetical protein K2W96_08895 [Gemmataceae bacterium]|nr:hypothetical protein [Gemmataceae bacterium]
MGLTIRRTDGMPLPATPKTITEGDDPVLDARIKVGLAAARLNRDWLSAHWADLMPQARGKYVVVANQTAHLADSVREALDWADAQEPRDPGRILDFVPLHDRV